MNALYPIIRRVRRPLVLPVERPPDAKPVAVPVKAKAEPAVNPGAEVRKESNGKAASEQRGS